MPLPELSTKASVKFSMPEAAAMPERSASTGIAMSIYGLNSCTGLPPGGPPGEAVWRVYRDRVRLSGRAGGVERRHREGIDRIRRQVGDGEAGAGGGRDLVVVLEDRVTGDDPVAGHGRCVPAQRGGAARGCRGGELGRHGRDGVRGIDHPDHAPGLPRPAAVVRGIITLRPPLGLIAATAHHYWSGSVTALALP